tara:strand:- start:136 stop:558 length:423 start_codon:yes stop_codon:yes gene_type:complete
MIKNIEPLPLKLKSYSSVSNLYFKDTCGVASNYLIYDKNKKTILDYGSSRPNGFGLSKISFHAEELAIKKCNLINKKNIEIYIWKYNKNGSIKPWYCCKSCTKLAYKYNYNNKIFTFDKDTKISAITDEPNISLGNLMRH